VTTELSPYRGLAPFGDTDLDARLFFGRARETEIVAANLQAARLTVLYGASGVGKSSLLRAGVAHRMRQAGADEPRHVVVTCAEWRDDPLAVVASATEEAVSSAVGRRLELPAELALPDRLEALTGVLDGEVYLVLDQLEEYLLYHGADGGGPLAEALADIVSRPSLRVGVLLGIRDDALAQLDALKARVPALFGNLLRLDHLTRDEAREAIVKPLAVIGELGAGVVAAEPALVEAVLDQVSAGRIAVADARGTAPEPSPNGSIEAPFLQVVMERIWDVERAQESSVLRAATLDELGGAERIVEEHLDGALAALDAPQRDLAAAAFGFLVTPSGTKIAHSARDLADYAGVEATELRPVLDRLAAERILRPVADESGGEPRFEIYHDVLADAVLAWSTRHRSDRELERARHEARRRHRRLVAVAGVAVAGLAAVSALAVWALVERGNAERRTTEATAHELEARAITLLPVDPGLSLALAAEAARRLPGESAEVALRRALLADHLQQVIRFGGPVVDVELEPRDQLWAASSEGVARYYQSRPFRRALETRHDAAVTRVLPEFTGMATASLDRTARISVTPDMSATGERSLVMRHDAPVATMALGGACRRAVGADCLVTGAGRSLRTWDTAGGRLLDTIPLGMAAREVVLLPSGKAAVRGPGPVVAIVDLRRARVVRRWNLRDRVDTIAAHPTRELLAVGLSTGVVALWDAAKGRPSGRFPTHGKAVLDIDLRGNLLLSGSADGTAILRELDTGRPVPLPGGHSNHVRSVELALDETYALTASSDGTAKVWQVGGGSRLVALLAGHEDAVLDATFTDDTRRVVTGSLDGTVRVWSSGTRPELRPTRAAAPSPASTSASSPTGARAEVLGDDVRLVTADGRSLRLQGHRDRVNSVAFSRDGALLVSAARDHEARIWDAESGALVHKLTGIHSGSVSDARFSPDGRWVVTAGPVVAGLWNARTGEFVALLRGPKTRVTAAAFSADSRTITTAERGGAVKRFRCDWCGTADELLVLADARMRATGQALTADERRRYLG
jgi:WD40 repeat protein